MRFEGWGSPQGFYLGFPLRLSGYLLLAGYLAFTLLVLLRSRNRKATRASPGAQGLTLLLMLVAPLAALSFLIRLPGTAVLAAPGQPLVPDGPAFSIFGAVPWLLAGGYLGVFPAILVALIGGLARGGWGTLHLMTPASAMAQAALAAWLLRRDYREWPGRLARRPVFSALVVGLMFGFLGGIEEFSYSGSDFYAALDFSLSRLGPIVLAGTLELGIGGMLTEGIRWAFPERWYTPARLVVGPYNRSLAARLATMLFVLGLGGAGVLTYANWILARSSAEEVISDQMIQTASQASESIPLFIQSGRSSLRQLAQELQAQQLSADQLTDELELQRSALTYFSRLAVFGPGRSLVASAAPDAFAAQALPLEVEAALASALNGVPLEVATGPPAEGEGVQLVFLTPLTYANGEQGALAGWADLARTPMLSPVHAGLDGYADGEAFITDERGVILMHPDPASWLKRIDPSQYRDHEVHSRVGRGGARELAYAQPVEGYSWRVIISTPQRVVDTLALSSTVNLLAAMSLIGAFVVLAAYLSTRRLTQPLREMAATAELIAEGNLEHPVAHRSEDELGRLAVSFEHMRASLRTRLQEMDVLLNTGRQMAESFELADSLPPILANLRELFQADAVRLVLAEDIHREDGHQVFQSGEASKEWSLLDRQLLELSRERGHFVLENPSRARAVLDVGALTEPLEALAAVPLQHEDSSLGVLWVGHRNRYTYAGTDIDLLTILARQLATSLANTQLYHQAEGERHRLMAILESTPDAVIAIDRRGTLSLANTAAEAVLETSAEEALGQPAEDCIRSPELVLLLTQPEGDEHTVEIKVEGGRMLFASATDVFDGAGQTIGRVAVLWDITQYKVLDTLKSEFVSTVSHDLRAPLTLMRGYATMLSMVGEVNEQQQEFVQKILTSVERMTKLVDDLLDLSRIETGIGLSLDQVDLAEIMEDIISSFRPQAVNKQIALQVEIQDGLETVEADPMLLRQAIANLVDNAIKFTPAGGRVTVRASQTEGRQIIVVEDTGAGIAPADQPRLFEKFFRAHRMEESGKRGSGLGLAIVKSIVEQHHGRVQVESRLGVGSKFTLGFPMRQLQPEPVS